MHAPCHKTPYMQNNKLQRGNGNLPPPVITYSAKNAGKIYRLTLLRRQDEMN